MRLPVYVFDVDGVLNEVVHHQNDERVLRQIARLLDYGAYAAINTGRGYEWVKANVVRPIQSYAQSAKSLHRFYVSVEMGGLGVDYLNGSENRTRSAFGLLPKQIALARKTSEAHPEFADTPCWYEGKQTMATLEKKEAVPLEAFRRPQQEMAEILRGVFAGQYLKVAANNDSIDIHATEAGKWAGAQLIYDWLESSTDIKHDRFICFGDSPADYEMARFFANQKHGTTFVYTGPSPETLSDDINIALEKTGQLYNEGTHDYLQGHVQVEPYVSSF